LNVSLTQYRTYPGHVTTRTSTTIQITQKKYANRKMDRRWHRERIVSYSCEPFNSHTKNTRHVSKLD